MDKDKILIISGASGYIGSNLIGKLISLRNNIVITKRSTKYDYEFLDLENNKYQLNELKNKEILLIHLATFYSKDPGDSKKIKMSNEDFGKDLVKKLIKFNLKKIIYTNSMFSFYNDKNIRNLEYSKSKNNFSCFLKQISNSESLIFEEIYLDNSFGNVDKRNKVIPLIMKSLISNSENPIANADAYINLVHIDDVVQRIILSANTLQAGSTAFISKFSYNIQSIYNFLYEYSTFNQINKTLLHKKNNNYIQPHPRVDLKGIPLKKLSYALIDELKKYES